MNEGALEDRGREGQDENRKGEIGRASRGKNTKQDAGRKRKRSGERRARPGESRTSLSGCISLHCRGTLTHTHNHRLNIHSFNTSLHIPIYFVVDNLSLIYASTCHSLRP